LCLSGTYSRQATGQRHNHQYKTLGSIGRRVLSLAVLCLLTNRSANNKVNVVQAVNQDKVSFQIFEIDSPL
jgi:hypothetical protein